MQLTKETIETLRERLAEVREQGRHFFAQTDFEFVDWFGTDWGDNASGKITEHTDNLQNDRETLRQIIKELSVDIAAAARVSPLLADADMQELRHNTRQMLANLFCREYRHIGVYVHHDEDIVLGVDPPRHEEVPLQVPSRAPKYFDQAAVKTLDLVDLLLPSDFAGLSRTGTSNYRPNSAFVMMAIDDSNSELEDIREAIKGVFEEFRINAVVANEIEHAEGITDQILSEIDSSEFLIADLTHERPNVYYEIGYAHAHNKRVILVRKKNTKLHFDLAHRNCPEYENIQGLKRLLRKRLEVMTNRKSPTENSS